MRESELQMHYEKVVRAKLREGGRYANAHEVPALEKIVINSAISADAEKSWADEVSKEIAMIAGQKPIIIKSRKSISNFKLRAGIPNAAKVTLRKRKMYEFFYRLVSIALPLIRDFRGLQQKFDGHGNYTFGLQDHSIFPEVNVDRERRAIGMDVTFVTTAKTDAEALELFSLMGLPFTKRFGSGGRAA
jgi:large subunit ribosomal protein L5